MEEVRRAAELEGVALNQLINVAVAEKISALRTEEYFRERAQRANRSETLRVLARSGRDNKPMSGDELPKGKKEVRRKTKKESSAAGGKHRQRANTRAN
jgi:hypothetical protein